MKVTRTLIKTLPEWAQTHIYVLKDERTKAESRADAAERQVRDMARELARVRIERDRLFNNN